MADEQGELSVKIVLDDGSIVQGFVKVENQAKKSSKNIEKDFNGLTDSLSDGVKGIATAFVSLFALNKVKNFIQDSAKAAGEAERATNQLASSLAQIGKFSPEAVRGFQEYASQLQKTTGIQDDLIIQNAALLTSLGNLSGDKLKQATKAALDFAKGAQLDTATAFELVAKAAGGNTAALSRYTIKVDESIDKTKRFDVALATIEKRFGGLAETNLNTFDGALQNLTNGFGELEESIGRVITNSPALRSIINTLAQTFFSLGDSIDKIRGRNGDIFKPALISALELASGINEFFIKPLELGFNFLKIGIGTVKLAIDAILVAATGFGKLFVEALVFPVRDAASALGSLISVVSSETGGKLKAAALRIASDITTPFQQAFYEAKLGLEDTFNSLTDEANHAFDDKIGGSIESFIQKLKKGVEQSKAIQADYVNNTEAQTVQLTDAWKKAQEEISKAIQDGIVKSISSGLSQIGANLVKGAGAFDNFGNVIMGILGDLAITVGGILIGIGLGLENLKIALATFNGFALVAAGAALIVLGGALKAMSGGSSAPSSQPVGGGVNANPSPTTELTPSSDLQRTEPNTKVEVVIQGSVYDSDETGSRIVDLINNAFDKKGVVISRGAIA